MSKLTGAGHPFRLWWRDCPPGRERLWVCLVTLQPTPSPTHYLLNYLFIHRVFSCVDATIFIKAWKHHLGRGRLRSLVLAGCSAQPCLLETTGWGGDFGAGTE